MRRKKKQKIDKEQEDIIDITDFYINEYQLVFTRVFKIYNFKMYFMYLLQLLYILYFLLYPSYILVQNLESITYSSKHCLF